MNQYHLFMSLIFICINNFDMPLLKVAPKIAKINNVIPVHIYLIELLIFFISSKNAHYRKATLSSLF